MSFTSNIDEIIGKNENGQLSIAEHWQRVRLTEIGNVQNGYPFDSTKFNAERGIPLVRIRDVTSGKTATFYDGEVPPGYLIHDGDILVGMDGDFNVRRWSGPEALLNQRVCRVTVDESFYDIRFMFYCLPGYLDAINASTPSITVKHLSSRTLSETPFPLAPLAEQKVIADKLDALLAQVDTLKARLEAIPAILKRFRQSVLSAAVTGKLTKDLQSNGRDGWTEGVLSEFCQKISDGEHQTPVRSNSGRILLSARNVLNGSIALNNVDYVGESEFSRIRKRCDPDVGDVLLSCSGTVGRVCLVDKNNEYVLVRSVAFIRPKQTIIPKLLMFFLQSPELQKQIRDKSKSTAQSNIFLGSISSLEIAIPTLPEQTEIVRRVESLFAFADQIEARAQEATARVKHLTQSILAKAFRGELTEEWRKTHPELVSGENSAEALLERIRATRATVASSTPRGRKPGARPTSSTPAQTSRRLLAAEAPKRRGRPRKT